MVLAMLNDEDKLSQISNKNFQITIGIFEFGLDVVFFMALQFRLDTNSVFLSNKINGVFNKPIFINK